MQTTSQLQKDELRVNLISLTEACPLDKCDAEDCPLYALRKMKPRQRLQWFNALTEDDLIYLATYHHICLTTKLALKELALKEAGKVL